MLVVQEVAGEDEDKEEDVEEDEVEEVVEEVVEAGECRVVVEDEDEDEEDNNNSSSSNSNSVSRVIFGIVRPLKSCHTYHLQGLQRVAEPLRATETGSPTYATHSGEALTHAVVAVDGPGIEKIRLPKYAVSLGEVVDSGVIMRRRPPSQLLGRQLFR